AAGRRLRGEGPAGELAVSRAHAVAARQRILRQRQSRSQAGPAEGHAATVCAVRGDRRRRRVPGLGRRLLRPRRFDRGRRRPDHQLSARDDPECSPVTDVLKGVRVVELSTVITAPLAGMMLADLGADVIKVEHPQGGDPFRTFRGEQYSPNFVAYNRGKRSIQLDLRADAGRSILLKLVARADVLLENYRPGIMEKLGLGDDVLTAANARLIHCSITGFGASGPYSARP